MPAVRSCATKFLRPRDAAEHHRPGRNVGGNNAATRFPDQLLVERKRLRRRAAGEHDRIGAAERGQRLAQSSGGKQAVASIFGSDQHDIEIAGEGAMLEAIVEQVELRSELLLGKDAGGVAVFADDDRDIQTPRHQQRFIAEIAR